MAAAELLISQIKATTFAEFQCQVPRVEECFTSLVLQLVNADSTADRLQKLLTRLICSLAAEYWLESQCFENFFGEQIRTLTAQNQPVARLLISEILASIKMLVAATENNASGLEDDDVAKAAEQSAAQGQGTATNDSLNHRAYKTVLLFKSSAIFSIYDLCCQSFTALLG